MIRRLTLPLLALLLATPLAGLVAASPASAAPIVVGVAADLLPPKKMGTVQAAARLRAAARQNNAIPGAMSYHGGTVATSVQPVYLVLWGSDWGTRGQDANGYDTFTNDPQGTVPVLEAMYAGIGRNAERWSAVPTQYCSGAAYGATTCAADNASHIAYPIHGVFDQSHVYYDDANPYGADNKTQLDVKNEARRAQLHFNSPANAQYIVLTPTGTHPDNFNISGHGFCGWHSWSALYSFSYTLLPYSPDAGAACGVNKLGPGHPFDGVTATAGHEYQETITDLQTGWIDQIGGVDFTGWYDASLWENGDKCAWISSGPGAMAGVTFSTGTFTQQTEWSNEADACVMTQNVVEGGNGAQLSDPGSQTPVVGHTFSLSLQGAQSDGGTLSYDAGALPAGLSLNAATGVIAGVPSAAGSTIAAVQARSSTGATATVFVSFVVSQIPVALADPGTTKATMGRSFSLSPVATVSSGTPAFSATGLPAWASLDTASGRISGTPDALGTSSVTLTATVGGQSDSVTFSLIVGGQVNVTAIPSKSFITGKAASIQVAASDSASGTLHYGATSLPDGLSIDADSGLISGTPSTVGSGTATVSVHGGEDIDTTFTWSVVASTITATSPLVIQVLPGKATTSKLRATSNSGLPVTFSPLSPYATANCGLTLQSNGSFSGTSNNWGAMTLTCDGWQIVATDGYATLTLSVAITISPVTVNLNPADSTSLYAGKATSVRMMGKATNNRAVTYTATGLPTGMTINASTGVISGTPSKTGTLTSTIVAHSGTDASSDYKVRFVVARPTISLTLPQSSSAHRNQAVTLTITATDSAGEAITFKATGLPAGLVINASTGVISGKPKTSAVLKTYTVSITATDPGGASASGTFPLQLNS